MRSLHEFNEREKVKIILADLMQGKSIALVSDAGTPLISDPGYRLIKEAKTNGICVVPIPGPCAAIAALSAAGLPSDKFIFEGFLPIKEEACRHYLSTLLHETRTLIFYEAPHRLLSALHVMVQVFGGKREAVIARELTKIHENILANHLDGLIEHFKTHPDEERGEIVILIKGSEEKEKETIAVRIDDVLTTLLGELSVKQAVSITSKITGERKNKLYELALTKKTN